MGNRPGNGEEHEEYLDAVVMALGGAAALPGARITVSDEAATYGLTSAGRAILRVPLIIEATYSLR
jgi:hypothetical protein